MAHAPAARQAGGACCPNRANKPLHGHYQKVPVILPNVKNGILNKHQQSREHRSGIGAASSMTPESAGVCPEFRPVVQSINNNDILQQHFHAELNAGNDLGYYTFPLWKSKLGGTMLRSFPQEHPEGKRATQGATPKQQKLYSM